MSDAVARAVLGCRMAPAGPRTRRFTVDRVEALARQRTRSQDRWAWTLHVVRGLFSLVDGANLRLEYTYPTAEQDHLRIALWFDASALSGLPVGGLLDAALDPGKPDHDGALVERQRRFLHRLGRGINEALGGEAVGIEVRLTGILHRFVRTPAVPGGWSEFVSEIPAAQVRPHTPALDIDVRLTSQSFEQLAMGGAGIAGIMRLWHAHVPGLESDGDAWVLRPFPSDRPMQLGKDARWWRRPLDAIALVRDGVVMPTRLGAALAQHRVPVQEFDGIADAPRLRLTYDEGAVIQDEALALLAAWFHDVVAHAVRARVPAGTRSPAALLGAAWPSTLGGVWTVDGQAVAVDALAEAASAGREVWFAWRHELDVVPHDVRASTLALWPSELELLRLAIPTLSLVPLARAQVASGRATDWATLVQGCLPELALCVIPRSVEIPARIDVTAFIHRGGAGEFGSIDLVWNGRSVARTLDTSLAIPGVTLFGHVSTNDARWSSTPTAMQSTLHAVAQAARARLDELLAHARDTSTPGSSLPPIVARIEAGTIAHSLSPEVRASAPTRTSMPLAIVPVRGDGFAGVLELHADGEPTAIEVGVVDGPATTVTLHDPWAGVSGRVAIQPHASACDPHAIAIEALRQLLPAANHAALVHGLGHAARPRLVALVAACRSRTATDDGEDADAAVPCRLREVLVHTLLGTHALAVEHIVPVPSWRFAALTEMDDRGTSDDGAGRARRLELGAYRRWIAEGLHRPRGAEDVGLAAALVLATLDQDADGRERSLRRLLACARRWQSASPP